MYRNRSPFTPLLLRTMGYLLGGAAIASLWYGPGVLITAIVSLIIVSVLISRWDKMLP